MRAITVQATLQAQSELAKCSTASASPQPGWRHGSTPHLSKRGRRGLGLAGVLAVMLVAAIIAFSMAAVTTLHGQRAQRTVNTRTASYLAEGAIAQAMHHLKADPTYGTHGESITYGSDDHQAIISFDPSNSLSLPKVGGASVPWSHNNQAGATGTDATGWNGTVVAPGTVHLVASAAAGRQVRVVEALVGVPRFPFVVCANGTFTSSGSLSVRGATSAADFLANPDGANRPASIGAQAGISVGGSCYVSGDVVAQSAQSISLPPLSLVGGRVMSGEVRQPSIDITAYDPLILFSTTPVSNDSTIANDDGSACYTLSESAHYTPTTGLLRIAAPLVLKGAILYVEGNLQIDGAVSGTGLIAATGNITINGATSLSTVQASDTAALLANGDVTIAGSDVGSSYFQGLVYARGGFSASNLTIGGMFLCGSGSIKATGGAGGGGTATLNQVRAVLLPEMARAKLSVRGTDQSFWEEGWMGECKNGDTARMYQHCLYANVPFLLYDTDGLDEGSRAKRDYVSKVTRQMKARHPWFTYGMTQKERYSWGHSLPVAAPPGKSMFWPTSVGFNFNYNGRTWRCSIDFFVVYNGWEWMSKEGTPESTLWQGGPFQGHNDWIKPNYQGWGWFVNDYQCATPELGSDCSIVDDLGPYTGPSPAPNPTDYSSSPDFIAAYDAFLAEHGHSWAELRQAMVDYQGIIEACAQDVPHYVSGGTATVTIDLGDSRFYGTEQPIRVLSWSEHD